VSEGAISVGPVLAVVLVALVFIAVVVGLTGQLGVSRAVATASGRAVLQLAAVSRRWSGRGGRRPGSSC
jgi:putative ABC transport system permease protein